MSGATFAVTGDADGRLRVSIVETWATVEVEVGEATRPYPSHAPGCGDTGWPDHPANLFTYASYKPRLQRIEVVEAAFCRCSPDANRQVGNAPFRRVVGARDGIPPSRISREQVGP